MAKVFLNETYIEILIPMLSLTQEKIPQITELEDDENRWTDASENGKNINNDEKDDDGKGFIWSTIYAPFLWTGHLTHNLKWTIAVHLQHSLFS